MQVNFPHWVWLILGAMAVLILMALCKADFSIGAHGMHFTQDLIHSQ